MTSSYEGVAYDGSSRGHVESYFLKINDPGQTRALWIKATILAPKEGDVVAEGWGIAFERGKKPVAAKVTVPYAAAAFARASADVEMPGLSLSRERAHGEVGEAWFDLALSDASEPFVHFPHPRMYSGPFPSSKLVSPMPDLRARGEVRLRDGRHWKVDGWRGLLGHNWGRGHAFAYAWGHCNVWDKETDLVLEGTSARVRVGPVLTPTATLLVVRAGGATHYLTRMRQIFRSQGSMTFRRWQFDGRGKDVHVRGELWAESEDMAGLRYDNPDGAVTHCLNSKLASARVEVTLPGRTPIVATSRAAALEIGTRDGHHGVEMLA